MTMPKFKYGDTAAISGAAIEDGSFLVDTSTGCMYVDLGSARHHIGGIEYINDTRSAAGANWTGVSKDRALYDGKTVLFHLAYNSTSNTTLNLTLNDGSTTGAKNVFFNATTRLSTQYVATNVVMLSYVAANDAWYVANRYVDNNTTTYIGTAQGAIAGTGGVTANTPIVYVPANNGYSTVAAGLAFSLAYPIYYTSNAYSAAATIVNTYLLRADALNARNIPALGSSYAGLTTNKPVYLVGTYADGLFTIDSSIFTCTPPTTYNGKVYLLIGAAWSTYQYTFFPERKLYKFYDGAFQEWTPSEPEMPEYIVANATTTGVNGTYVFDPSEYGYENSPVFTNGTYYLYRAYAIEQQRVIWVFNTSVVDHGTGQDRTWNYGSIVANSTSATVPTESGYSESELTVTVNRDYYIKSEVDSKVSTLNSSITTLSTRVNDKQDKLPTSGSTGQYLQKTANGVQWATVTDGSAAINMANCRVLALSDASTIQSIGLCNSELTNKTAGNYLVIWTGEYTLDSDSSNPTDQVLVPGMLYLLFAGATVWSLSRIGIWANDGSTFKQGNLNEWFLLKADFASIMAGTSTLAGLSTKRGLTLAVSATENKYVYVDYASKFASLEARVAALEEGSSTPTTGSLTVNGVGFPSGAQWTVGGGTTWYNIGDTATLSPGSYTITYKEVSGYATPSSQSATVSAGSTTTITANSYVQYGTLLVNYTGTAPSGAQWTHDGGTTWTNFGSSVNIVPGTYTVSYKTVNGYTAPSSTSATVTGGSTTTITAGTYTANASTFGLVVSGPNIPSGAQWSYNGGSTWNNFPGNATLTPGTYTLTFKDVTGYITPSSLTFTAQAGDSISYSDIRYVRYGILSVHLSNNAGGEGRWIVNGTEYASDSSPSLAPGDYTITFKAVSGYTTPAAQTATVVSQQTTQLTAEYVRQSAGGNGYIVINDQQSNGLRSGVYTLVEGTENSGSTYANGGSLWKHQTLPYYLYYAGSGTSYWYLSSVPGSTSNDAKQVSYASGNPTSVFLGGSTKDKVTINYFVGTAPSGGHLTVWNTAGSYTYTGEYYLYSGTANTTSAVWKKTDGNYYILMNPSGSAGGWTIYNAASTSGTDLVRLVGSTSQSAETVFNGGVTSGNHIVFYSDGVAGSTSAQHPDSIALTFPESFTDPMYSQTVTIDDAYNGTYAYSGDCKLFGYVDTSTYTNKYVVRPVYVNGNKTLCQGTNPQDAGGFALYWGVGTMGNVTYLYSSSSDDSIGVLTGSKTWSYGYATFAVSGVYNSGLTDSGSGAHITMVNGNNAKYDGNWYLTSGAANSTGSVWTHFSGKYTLSHNSYWWIHDGSKTIQATSASAGAPSSWSGGTDYNSITMTYHAS